jgi:hypothetical protein
MGPYTEARVGTEAGKCLKRPDALKGQKGQVPYEVPYEVPYARTLT